jgi:hypothetical protein
VSASSNHACVTCPHSSNDPLISDDPSLLWALVATTRVRRGPIVAMSEVNPSLLGHHNRDVIAAVSHLSIAREGYGPLAHKRIVVV